MATGLLPGFNDQPYWHDQLDAPPVLPDVPLANVDVLVVGAGYTGLNAAIETARAGRSTMVVDAADPGYGCSSRNGGQISTSVKPSLAKLTAKFGAEKARAIRGEGASALAWIAERIQSEGIACDFARSGRFHAAHTPQHYEALTRDAEILTHDEGIAVHAVPRTEQRSELGTDSYWGGLVYPDHCSLHPAKYLRGLLRSAMRAGAHVTGQAAVTQITRTPTGFDVQTLKGKVRARDVIVATNGYTTGVTPWLQRRVIPIGSYIIATEPLPKGLMDQLFPTRRIASDTCKVLYYYRPSPDGTRILFGGRVSSRETDPAQSGPRLYDHMCRIFPEMRGYSITHSWSGTVAYSFDELAHTGIHDGVHYAMGYCGSGVSMASYLGMRVGQKVLGLAEGRTAFDGLPHPTRPFYTGKPWFLPAAVAWYQWNDRRQFANAQRAAM
ncbi:FAD-binding oxidoreductase [Roseovarius aestuarii]|nr:FAD-binding oxidoreductase [Roseovarius aestuarii]